MSAARAYPLSFEMPLAAANDNKSMDTGASGTRTVDYDARGNVTTLGNLAFLYDKSDQPVTVTGSANGVGAANGNYRYDGNLKRVKSVVNGKTIYNVYDASGGLIYVHKLAHGGEPEEKIDYIKAAGMSVARINYGVNTTYLHPDHLGSAQAGTTGFGYSDPWGTVAWREQYTPFGEEIQGQSANDDLAGFTGHIKDSATGLNYMQARYYDPVIGRFLSVDPMTFMDTGNPGMFNRYAYTFNDPVNLVDPDGNMGGPPISIYPDQIDVRVSQAEKDFVSGMGTAVRSTYRGVKQEARRQIVAPVSENTRNAIQQEDAVIAEVMGELMTNSEARSELADAAVDYISENPNKVAGRVTGTIAVNGAYSTATRGAGKVETLGQIAKAGASAGMKGAVLTTFATSGDVRQAAQDGVTNAEGFMKAFIGGEIDERNN